MRSAQEADEHLTELGWVLGPTIEAQTWLLDVRQRCRGRWKITAGTTFEGLPWVARTDMTDEHLAIAQPPWWRMRVQPRHFFESYPPPLVDPPATTELAVSGDDFGVETAEELAAELVSALAAVSVPTEDGEQTPLDHVEAVADGDSVTITLGNGMTFRLNVLLVDDGNLGPDDD